jgi:hypothetical protein
MNPKKDGRMKKSTQVKPSIVVCHGIRADGSCFNKVIPALQADGHEMMAAQYAVQRSTATQGV